MTKVDWYTCDDWDVVVKIGHNYTNVGFLY